MGKVTVTNAPPSGRLPKVSEPLRSKRAKLAMSSMPALLYVEESKSGGEAFAGVAYGEMGGVAVLSEVDGDVARAVFDGVADQFADKLGQRGALLKGQHYRRDLVKETPGADGSFQQGDQIFQGDGGIHALSEAAVSGLHSQDIMQTGEGADVRGDAFQSRSGNHKTPARHLDFGKGGDNLKVVFDAVMRLLYPALQSRVEGGGQCILFYKRLGQSLIHPNRLFALAQRV